jgi:methionyl-tRNA formyltransferase
LHDRLALLGAEAMVEVLDQLEAGRARAVPQPEAGVTYAAKIDKRDARLDWSRPAFELERAVRALRPAPGAFAMLDGEAIKIWRAEVLDATGEPGTATSMNDNLVIACASQSLAVSELQRAGGRRLSAAEFLRGRPLPPGARFQ